MKNPKKLLKLSLLLGGLYFLFLSAAHFFGIRVPMLFVYFDAAFGEVSGRMVSFFAFGWAMFFFCGAASDKELVNIMKYILLAGCGGIAGMAYANISTDYTALGFDENIAIFWVQSLLFLLYYVWLAVLFFEAKQGDKFSELTEYDTTVHSNKR